MHQHNGRRYGTSYSGATADDPKATQCNTYGTGSEMEFRAHAGDAVPVLPVGKAQTRSYDTWSLTGLFARRTSIVIKMLMLGLVKTR